MTTYTACRLSFHAIRPNGFRGGEIIKTCGHQHRTPAAAARCPRPYRHSDGLDTLYIEELWPEHDAAGRNTGRFIKTQCDRAARLVLSSDGEQLWPEYDAAGRNTGRFIKINDQ